MFEKNSPPQNQVLATPLLVVVIVNLGRLIVGKFFGWLTHRMDRILHSTSERESGVFTLGGAISLSGSCHRAHTHTHTHTPPSLVHRRLRFINLLLLLRDIGFLPIHINGLQRNAGLSLKLSQLDQLQVTNRFLTTIVIIELKNNNNNNQSFKAKSKKNNKKITKNNKKMI